jgi:exonuclease III
MKIVSFNLNCVRLRSHQLAEVIDRHAPEVVGLKYKRDVQVLPFAVDFKRVVA